MLRGLQGNECITYLSAFLKCLRSTVVKKKNSKLYRRLQLTIILFGIKELLSPSKQYEL